MAKPKDFCVQAARGPIMAALKGGEIPETQKEKEIFKMIARVGKPDMTF